MITPDDLADCQEDQLSAMWDRCIIRQPDSWQGEVLTEGPVAWSWLGHDEIPCRVAIDDTQPRLVAAGDQDLTVVRLVVTLPVAVCPTTNQVLTVVSSAQDPHMVGRRFDVTSSDVATFVTARRTHCIEHR
mgnify:CR=1 FL=1